MLCRLLLLLLLSTRVVAAPLPPELGSILTRSGFGAEDIALYVRAVDSPQPAVAWQAQKPMNPASVAKLLTTSAALGELGAGYRWLTEVWYTGELEGDTLKGDLYFRGNGDPYLTPERFWRLLNRLALYGIRHIQGDIVLDSSWFKPARPDYGGFDDQPYRTYNVGPNALLVGFQATEFHFDVQGEQVHIRAFPASPRLKVINEVRSSGGRCGAWSKRILLAPKVVDGVLEVRFSGRYARSCNRRTLYRRVAGREDHFQHFFLPLWQQLGGSFSGEFRHGSLPVKAEKILDAESVALAEAVRLINKFSNNVMTRQLLLSLGAKVYGPPGTTEKGLAAVQQWLQRNGLLTDGFQLENGAGLSRDTRVSAEMLGELLGYVYRQPYMPEFIASLPVAGLDGTLSGRFQGEALYGHAHIKTGLLDFVQTMAGYVTAANGRRYVVVMLHNDARAHTKAATALQNSVLRWVFSQPG